MDMRTIRLQFKYALRQCRSDGEMNRANALAWSLQCKDTTSFWKGVKGMRDSRVPLATKVGDAVGDVNITKLWQDHFSTLLNSVQNDEFKTFACESIGHSLSTVDAIVITRMHIGNPVYGTETIHRDAVTMTFKEFRCNTDTHHRYRGRHNHDQNDTYQTEKIQDLSNSRHTQVGDSSINNNYSGKSVTFSRSGYIKRSRPHDKFGRTHNMYKDHLQRQALVDTSCNQSQHITANKKLLESTTTRSHSQVLYLHRVNPTS